MPTDFNTGFNNDDIIEAEHVKQFAKPVNDLESGVAFFREATNTDEVFEVDFSESAIPGGAPGHVLESLEPGQMIVFKANADSQVDAELEVTLEGSSPESYPLFAGDTQIGQGQIKENQIVVAIFNDEGGGRFDVVGVTTESSGGGGGASDLNDLDDVTITSPTTGEVLRFDGTEFVNAEMSIADVDGLSPALDSKQDELTGVGDVPGLSTALAGKADTSHTHAASDIVSGELPVTRGGTGADNAGDARTNLDVPSNSDLSAGLAGKQDELTEPADVPGLTAALASKSDTSHTHAASDIVSGEIPVARGGTGADNATDARTNLDVPSNSELSAGLAGKQDELTGVGDVPGLSTALDGKQSLSEKGQPNGYASLDAGGLVPTSQLPSGSGGSSDWGDIGGTLSDQTDLQAALDGKAASSHTHAASNITSGTLADARIPNLNASKITSGTLPIARGGTGATTAASARSNLGAAASSHTHAASNITSGTLSDARIPNLDASKITAGVFSTLRIPNLSASKITSGSLNIPGSITNASITYAGITSYSGLVSTASSGWIGWDSQSKASTGSGTNAHIGLGGNLVRQTSQSKLKEQQAPLETTIDEIMAWQPKSFRWVEEMGGHEDIGLVAEEVAALDPRAAWCDHDQVLKSFEEPGNSKDPDSETVEVQRYHCCPEQPVVPLGVHYERAWVHLLAATQDFYRRYQESEELIESLFQENEELKSRLTALEEAS